MPLLVVLADISGGGMGEVLTCGVSAFGLEMTGTWMSVDNTSSLQIKDTRKISGHTVKQVVFPSAFSHYKYALSRETLNVAQYMYIFSEVRVNKTIPASGRVTS